MKNTSFWMKVSGATGFASFLIANFTNIFAGSAVIAGFCQLAVNAFVFVSWREGYRKSSGFKKFSAGIGTVVPIIMASITLIRVILPWAWALKH